MRTTIPLSHLTRSSLNVRTTESDIEIPSLADDIAARGLKQNLVVVPTEDADRYQVVAGGRRYQALALLAERGDLPADWPVPVLIDVPDEATETSLAENLSQVAMNPADEFKAFSTIIAERAEGTDAERIAYCARRFGKTETYVSGRLRLAALSETVLEGLRTNVIGLTQATAYASVADHALQDKVYAEQLKNNWKPHDPTQVRDALRSKTYSPQDGKVLFVTLKAYTAAGGRTDVDMFTLDATERLLDPAIIDKLVKEKLAKELPKFAKKQGATAAVVCAGHHQAPPAVKGWESMHDYQGEKVKARLAAGEPTTISVYLDHNGKLSVGATYLVPVDPNAEPEPERAQFVQKTPEERAEEERQRGIQLQAFRMAFPKCAGTVLEDRVYLPGLGTWARWEEDGDGWLVQAHVRVTKAELEAQMEAAAPIYDAAIAERARKIEEAKAEAAALKEKLVEDMATTPPAVIEVGDGTVFFRWEDGTYADEREEEGAPEADQSGTLQDLLAENDVKATWPTIEAYDADTADEDEDEGADELADA